MEMRVFLPPQFGSGRRFVLTCFFPECVAKGSRFLEVWGWSRVPPALRAQPQHHRKSLGLTIGRRSQSVIRMTCLRSIFTNSVLLLCFLACVEVAFEFCVAGVAVRELIEKITYKITSK